MIKVKARNTLAYVVTCVLVAALVGLAVSCNADGTVNVPKTVRTVQTLNDSARDVAASYGARGKAGAQAQILKVADQLDTILAKVKAYDGSNGARADIWLLADAASIVLTQVVAETDDADLAALLIGVNTSLRLLRDEFEPFPADVE